MTSARRSPLQFETLRKKKFKAFSDSSEPSLESSTQAIAVSTLFLNDLQGIGLPIHNLHCCSRRHLLDSLYRFARPRNLLPHFSDRLKKSFWISLVSSTRTITFSSFFVKRGVFFRSHLLEFSSIQVWPATLFLTRHNCGSFIKRLVEFLACAAPASCFDHLFRFSFPYFLFKISYGKMFHSIVQLITHTAMYRMLHLEFAFYVNKNVAWLSAVRGACYVK